MELDHELRRQAADLAAQRHQDLAGGDDRSDRLVAWQDTDAAQGGRQGHAVGRAFVGAAVRGDDFDRKGHRRGLLGLARSGEDLVDAALHVEVVLVHVVELAGEEHLEAAQRVVAGPAEEQIVVVAAGERRRVPLQRRVSPWLKNAGSEVRIRSRSPDFHDRGNVAKAYAPSHLGIVELVK